MTLRVVFDTNAVISALLFRNGTLVWLREHWASGKVVPLASSETVTELVAALAYPKFNLSRAEIEERLGAYIPHVEVRANLGAIKAPKCRDESDQKFVELAIAAGADVLVTGDRDLQVMRNQVSFAIESPEQYAKRF